MNRSSGNIQKEIIAESNLNDVMNLIAQMHRDREPLVHCAVFIEISAHALRQTSAFSWLFQPVRSTLCLSLIHIYLHPCG